MDDIKKSVPPKGLAFEISFSEFHGEPSKGYLVDSAGQITLDHFWKMFINAPYKNFRVCFSAAFAAIACVVFYQLVNAECWK